MEIARIGSCQFWNFPYPENANSDILLESCPFWQPPELPKLTIPEVAKNGNF